MKKWFGIFVAICIVLSAATGALAGSYMANNATAGDICEEGGFLSQKVNYGGKDYIIYKEIAQEKFQVVENYWDLYQYETHGTVHLTNPYSVYSFVNETKQCWGIAPIRGDEQDGQIMMPLQAEGTFLAVGNSENEILLSILGVDGRTITEYAYSFTGEWRENVSFSLTEEYFVVCAAYDKENLIVARNDGKVLQRDVVVQEVDIEPQDSVLSKCFEKKIIPGAEANWQMFCMKEAAVKCLIPVILLSAFISLLIAGRKQESMIYYMIICSEIVCLLGLLAAGYIFTQRLVKKEIMETGIETGYVLEEMKVRQRADETLETSLYWQMTKQYEELLEDVVIVDPTTYDVLQAKTMTKGMHLLEMMDEGVVSLVSQVAEGNKTAMKKIGQNAAKYVVVSRDFTQMEPESVLMAVISQVEIEKRLEDAILVVWNVIFLLIAVITILHMLIFLFFAAKWNKFVEGMKYVAHEKQSYAQRPASEDGLRSAWAPLDRIGHNLVKLRYERDLMYRNYYRFVPKGMDRLLGKLEMADIEIGDTKTIPGCLVHFQMENVKNISGDEYMDVMTESLKLMHQIREKHEGVFISAGGDLLNRKVFFEAGSKEALSFAVELYHEHSVKEELAGTNLIMMLHQADYYYGISGVEDMMTPFVYCEEEKVLDVYRDALAEAKVRIVVSERTLLDVGKGFCTRYIGFISGGAMAGSMKLYEILDAYAEEKRKIMVESDVFFQNALKLFYSNDFYLARNAFNNVLKLNEQDEIARWYLFHCEYHLNKPEAEVSYGLFEDTICDKKSYQS